MVRPNLQITREEFLLILCGHYALEVLSSSPSWTVLHCFTKRPHSFRCFWGVLFEECNFLLEELHALSLRKPAGASDGSSDERHDPYAHKYLQLA
nr:putative integron gene cassette protein [uncultured bacterium]